MRLRFFYFSIGLLVGLSCFIVFDSNKQVTIEPLVIDVSEDTSLTLLDKEKIEGLGLMKGAKFLDNSNIEKVKKQNAFSEPLSIQTNQNKYNIPKKQKNLSTTVDKKENVDEIIKVFTGKWYEKGSKEYEALLNAYQTKSNTLLKENKILEAIQFIEGALYHEHALFTDLNILLSSLYHHLGDSEKAYEILVHLKSSSSHTFEIQSFSAIQKKIIKQQSEFLIKNKLDAELLSFINTIEAYEPLPVEIIQHKTTALINLGKKFEAVKYINDQLTIHPEQRILEKFKNSIQEKELKLNSSTTETIKIPLIIHGEAMFVEVELNHDYKVKMLVDTGASMSHISRDAVEKLNLVNQTKGRKMFLTGAGRVELPLFELSELKLGDIKVNHFEVAGMVVDLGYEAQGVLGMNFLKHYSFQFDVLNKYLILNKRKL